MKKFKNVSVYKNTQGYILYVIASASQCLEELLDVEDETFDQTGFNIL